MTTYRGKTHFSDGKIKRHTDPISPLKPRGIIATLCRMATFKQGGLKWTMDKYNVTCITCMIWVKSGKVPV